MKTLIRAALFVLLLFVLSTLGLTQVTITASSSTTTSPSTLTAGSFVSVTLAPGPNTIVVDVAGTFTGQLALLVAYQGGAGPLRTWPAASISNCLASGTGLTANTAGTWQATIPGPGTLYLTATSLASGTPSVFLGAGSYSSSLAATSAAISAAPAFRVAALRKAPSCAPRRPSTISTLAPCRSASRRRKGPFHGSRRS